eukprot:4656000-Amphidinium_carterae.1
MHCRRAKARENFRKARKAARMVANTWEKTQKAKASNQASRPAKAKTKAKQCSAGNVKDMDTEQENALIDSDKGDKNEVTGGTGDAPAGNEATVQVLETETIKRGMDLLVDSGSEIHVAPKEFHPEIPFGSEQQNITVRAAGGHILRRYGEMMIPLSTATSEQLLVRFHIAE